MDRALDSDINAETHFHTCGNCGKSVDIGRGFGFKANSAVVNLDTALELIDTIKCLSCAVRHMPMFTSSLKVAFVVGTALTLLNQGDTLFSGGWPNALYWKIPLTYCVPFLVATFGALSNVRRYPNHHTSTLISTPIARLQTG